MSIFDFLAISQQGNTQMHYNFYYDYIENNTNVKNHIAGFYDKDISVIFIYNFNNVYRVCKQI